MNRIPQRTRDGNNVLASSAISHGDRDEIKRRAEADFRHLFEELGGRLRGRGLFCPFHKNTNTPAAGIHRGRFRCFGCGLSLDVIEFVERMLGMDFRTALEWLADRYGVNLRDNKLSVEQKREYTRRRVAAEAEARRVVAWRNDLLQQARDRRERTLWACHRCIRHVIHCGKLEQCCELAMEAADVYEARYEAMDAQIGTFAKANWGEIAAIYREQNPPRVTR